MRTQETDTLFFLVAASALGRDSGVDGLFKVGKKGVDGSFFIKLVR